MRLKEPLGVRTPRKVHEDRGFRPDLEEEGDLTSDNGNGPDAETTAATHRKEGRKEKR